MNVMKNEWFPFVTKEIKAKRGWDTFYYGNTGGGGPGVGGGRAGGGARARAAGAGAAARARRAGGRGGAAAARRRGAAGGAAGAVRRDRARRRTRRRRRALGGRRRAAPSDPMRSWNTFEHVPRFHNNYVGLRNRFALLSEAYAYATFEDRIKATNYFMEEALNFAHAERRQAEEDRRRRRPRSDRRQGSWPRGTRSSADGTIDDPHGRGRRRGQPGQRRAA